MSGEQGTMTEIATILLNLVLTMVLYGAFPMVFAVTRKKAIRDRKYKILCYVVNLLIKLVLYRGSALNLAPYVLWTFVFSRFGITILGNRGVPAVVPENREVADEEIELTTNELEEGSISQAPVDMPQRKELTSVKTLAEVVKNDDILCPYCGFELFEGSAFCSHCGKAVETTEFDIEDGVLKNYTGPGGNVVIPSSVTKIGNLAFCGRKEITSVVIPDGVTQIGEWAFRECENLANVVIPDSVTKIGNEAFKYCDRLADENGFVIICGVLHGFAGNQEVVVIPEDVTEIGEIAFYNCSDITNVIIPDGVTEIKDEAFFTCHSLTSITIPASVTSIGEGVFDECYELTIRAPKGSFAAHYAADNGINYVAE